MKRLRKLWAWLFPHLRPGTGCYRVAVRFYVMRWHEGPQAGRVWAGWQVHESSRGGLSGRRRCASRKHRSDAMALRERWIAEAKEAGARFR